MKIFIWEKVLCDFNCGMAVAYAESLEEALDGFKNLEGNYFEADQLGEPIKIIDVEKDKRPFVAFVYGGG